MLVCYCFTFYGLNHREILIVKLCNSIHSKSLYELSRTDSLRNIILALLLLLLNILFCAEHLHTKNLQKIDSKIVNLQKLDSKIVSLHNS